MKEFNVGIVGAGHVGLVTCACLAHIGHRVTLVDVDAERMRALEQGKIPIYEPGLEELVDKNADQMLFTMELAPVVCGADIIFIAVDTPPGEDRSAALSNVADVAWTIGRSLSRVESGEVSDNN